MVARVESNPMPGIVAGLAGHKSSIAGFPTSSERLFQLDVPQHFTLEDIRRVQADCDSFANILREHPNEVVELLAAVRRDNLPEAKQLAQKLGLTETDFSSQGGGFLWLLAAAVVVGVLLLTEGTAR